MTETLPIPEDRIVGRLAGGDIAALDPGEVASLIDVPNTVYVDAPSGGDDAAPITTAITTAVTAAQNDGTNVCRVKLGPGVFTATRALQQTTPATNIKTNAQILIPWIPRTQQKVTLIIEGCAPAGLQAMYGQNVKQEQGTVIKSTLTGCSYDATYHIPALMGAISAVPDSNTHTNLFVVLRNLTLRCPDNPSLAGFHGQFIGHVEVDNVNFSTDVIEGDATYLGGNQSAIAMPTHPTGVGLIMPGWAANSISRARNIVFTGWYLGMYFGDHCDVKNMTLEKCKVVASPGYGIAAGWFHCASFGYISAASCVYGFAQVTDSGVDPTNMADTPIRVTVYDDESDNSAAPWTRVTQIDDPNNKFHGWFWYMNNSGEAIAVNGASNLTIYEMT